MDTREKIIAPERALAIAEELRQKSVCVHVVTGYFDVLRPALLSRLREVAGEGTRLFAFVLDSEEALLTGRARAELAAALRVIDYVIPCPGNASQLLLAMQPNQLTREEIAHRDSTEQLIEHVFQRHSLERKRRTLH